MTERAKKSKRDKLFDNLLKVTRQFMMGRGFLPLTLDELIDKLHIPPQNRPLFSEVMNSLVRMGEASFSNNTYRWKKEKGDALSGTIRMHPRGFGFVELDAPSIYSEDIFIPKHLTQNAVDGDKVEVLVNTESVSEKGPEGRVLLILERSRTHIAGIIREIDRNGNLIAYVPLLGLTQRVVVDAGGEKAIGVGDRIVMEVVDWGGKNEETLCRFTEHLGHIDDYSCDIRATIEEYQLRKEFPLEAIEEAKKFGTRVSKKQMEGRLDLREQPCITIDPKTAKDFDDALYLKKDKKKNYHLFVHIADVTHYVAPDSALDKEAIKRCNSTYFPGYCLPMLPKELSNNLCSLRPDVNRLAVTVEMVIAPSGKLLSYTIQRSVIRSVRRFTYEEAKQILDGKRKSRHLPMLREMEGLCHILKRERFKRGSLDLSLPELVVVVDDKGLPLQTETVEYDITHQLVEEFMLKANEVVARHLDDEGHSVAFRVHDTPPDENLKEFVDLARSFGFELPDVPTQEDLQKFFDRATKTPYGQHLSACYIRRMRMAVYSPENIGHYGLSLTHYCHFTSPIRRYADILVHRTLFDNGLKNEELQPLTLLCSEQERVSARAENSIKLLKKLRLISKRQEEEPYSEYDAVITSIKPWGITIEVVAFMIESFIHISEIGNDYFEFVEREMKLVGRRSRLTYRSGDSVEVILRDVDFITLESRWDLVTELSEEDEKKERGKGRGRRGKRGDRKKRRRG